MLYNRLDMYPAALKNAMATRERFEAEHEHAIRHLRQYTVLLQNESLAAADMHDWKHVLMIIKKLTALRDHPVANQVEMTPALRSRVDKHIKMLTLWHHVAHGKFKEGMISGSEMVDRAENMSEYDFNNWWLSHIDYAVCALHTANFNKCEQLIRSITSVEKSLPHNLLTPFRFLEIMLQAEYQHYQLLPHKARALARYLKKEKLETEETKTLLKFFTELANETNRNKRLFIRCSERLQQLKALPVSNSIQILRWLK
jgi:hypothetical protein